ncbi:MAG: alpha/beta hydrolase [Steroidobacteraceae bacterium]
MDPASAEGERCTSDDGVTLFYNKYGPPSAPLTVVCLPGLTRNSRDFATLATRLSGRHRVLCPDFRGRGRSGWDPDPANYHPRRYAEDVRQILGKEAPRRVVLVGTSLGGVVSALLAQQGLRGLEAVVLNDIGPEVDPAGRARIAGYVGAGKALANWDEAVAAVRRINASALPGMSDAQWLAFARGLCRDAGDGTVAFDYDPAIGRAYRAGAGGALQLWPAFESLARLRCLLLRGAHSDILGVATVERMRARLPALRVVDVPGRGHAPLLDEPECVDAIEALLGQVGRETAT